MKNNILLFLLSYVLYSCSVHSDSLQTYLNEQLEEYYASAFSDYSYIVIIPRKGCHACTMEADAFYKKNREDNRCLFIFTDLVSEKLLKIEVGYDNVCRKNVLVDKEGHFHSSQYADSEYPLLLTKKENGQFKCSYLLDSEGLLPQM